MSNINLKIGDDFILDDNKWHTLTVEVWLKKSGDKMKSNSLIYYKDCKYNERIFIEGVNEKEMFKKIKKYKADYFS